jgi:hypothetical protein
MMLRFLLWTLLFLTIYAPCLAAVLWSIAK